jgi:hypothetical protein
MSAGQSELSHARATKCTNGYTSPELMKCENMKCTYEGMDGERYRCEWCGQSFYLDYEEMR